MRLSTLGRTTLLGGALALAMTGCKDDDASCPALDASMDAGRDSGQDSGPADAGSLPPVHLRIAHMGWGTGVGPVHICAYDPDSGNHLLISSTALATGAFTSAANAQPIPFGAITPHLEIPEALFNLLAGQTISIYRVADSGAPGSSLATANDPGAPGQPASAPLFCTPTADTAIGSVKVGPGDGEFALIPGHSYTLYVGGAAGAEIQGPQLANSAPFVRVFEDEKADTRSPAPATTRARFILNDRTTGSTPGLCRSTTAGGARTSVLGAGDTRLPYVLFGTPTYLDVTQAPTSGYLWLHANVGGAGPCDMTAGTWNTAGAIPNPFLQSKYAALKAAGSPVPDILGSLPAAAVSTVFITPVLTEFYNFATSAYCAPGSAPECQPSFVDTAASFAHCNPGALTAGCIPEPAWYDATTSMYCEQGSSVNCQPSFVNIASPTGAHCAAGSATTCLPESPQRPSAHAFWTPTSFPVADEIP